MEEWVPAPGTPQPHNEGYDSANDMIHLDSPASPDPLDDTLASHPLRQLIRAVREAAAAAAAAAT